MDDVTIEDDIQANEQPTIQTQIKSSLFDQQLIYLCFLSIFLLLFIYFYQKRKSNSANGTNNIPNEDELMNRYEQIEKIREKQQKAYEEQMARHEQRRKERIENTEKIENKPLKYRESDHNPLTGQSNSCSWKSSTSRRKPVGG